MNKSAQNNLKKSVVAYWDEQSCGTEFTDKPIHTREYFEEIESHRYKAEPQIFPFAQFTRHHGQKMLEVGIGAGSDFLQWVRAGTDAHGLDITQEGINNVRERLKIYNLKAKLQLGDSENLPYKDKTFDLVYSWGVIHHTPDTNQAMREIIRVLKPGGTAKIMLYHHASLVTFLLWIRWALLTGHPWRSFNWCLANHMESPGTKAYNPRDIRKMLNGQPVKALTMSTKLTIYDTLCFAPKFIQVIPRFLAYVLGGDRVGWFLLIEFTKKKS
jgi:SAM-dependent methyltransferase